MAQCLHPLRRQRQPDREHRWQAGRFRKRIVEVGADGVERLLAGAKALERFEGLSAEQSADELSRLMRAALGPLKAAEVGEDMRTIGETTFAVESVYVHHWRRGEALLFDNTRMLHSTVPVDNYQLDGRRLMWQIICKTQ